ncbi:MULTISPECIES: hypothetical protein [unclassified Bradyrhizobium]|uniref:hypothetical protein n=1 Tax=unclassified Bradyrhizobium TaxID=2631580 RepID=UPI002916C679|nr:MULTISPECIES: hypothetical protein [unclassified Bradyrhizobium]
MTEEWPSYLTGRRDHIHALGVISLSYSAFERDLFTLYAHHPGVKGMPRELVDKYWSSQSEFNQVKSVREIFQMYETDPAPLKFVNKLMDYFDWCSHTRNQLMHSEYYPSIFGGVADKLYLIKRASKAKSESIYITLTVDQLRDIADKIEHGKRECAAFIIWLRIRDIPREELPRSYGVYAADPMPEPLETPAKITGLDRPHDDPPEYLKRMSERPI